MPRVLTARFMHETNTFSRVKTDMALIRRRDFHLENEIPQAFRGTRSALGATFEAADKYGWTLVHPVSVCPSLSPSMPDRSRAETWTKMSFPPSFGAMKLAALGVEPFHCTGLLDHCIGSSPVRCLGPKARPL